MSLEIDTIVNRFDTGSERESASTTKGDTVKPGVFARCSATYVAMPALSVK